MANGQQTRVRKTSRWVLALGVVVALLLCGGTAVHIIGDKAELIGEVQRDLRRYNILLVEQTERIIDSVDAVLRATVTQMEGESAWRWEERRHHERLKSITVGMPFIRAITIVGADAIPIATTFVYPSTRPNLSHRGYYKTLRDNPDAGLYVGPPVKAVGKPKGEWIINIARRINDSEGAFNGLVIVSLSPKYFTSFYESLDLGKGSYVSLLRDDSVLMARYPHLEKAIGQTCGRNPALQPFLKERRAETTLRMYSHMSKTNVALNCRFAKRHPLYVCVSMIEDTYLEDWTRDSYALGAVTFLLTFIILGAFYLLARQVRARDLAEQRLSAKAFDLESANRELERSNQELQQFAYVASHDLNEPLNVVSGYTALFVDRHRDKIDEDANEWIGYMDSAVVRMKHLIKDLLAYSRVTTKAEPFSPCDLNAIMEAAAANLKTRIDETGASIVHDDLPTLNVDRTQAVSLFQNLLSNAIKYRFPNRTPEIRIGAQRLGDVWEFSVDDNGIGIDEGHHRSIFEIFHRLQPDDEGGTGIGLSICKKIVERHGGSIRVESQLGSGATFFFTLPAD